MTPNPLCVNQTSNLSSAAKLMSTHRISGIPVVDDSGKLTGIISKTDLTQAVATSDETSVSEAVASWTKDAIHPSQ